MSSDVPKPFKVAISDTELDALKHRLALTRLPDELDDADWHYGAPLADVTRLTARLRNGYDWKAREAEINQLPQFTQDIEVDGFGTLDIHYVHQKSVLENAIPLLFVHGCKGWVLSRGTEDTPSLDAGIPRPSELPCGNLSLPGYGFSEAPRKKGFKTAQYAEVGNKLMLSLGYTEFVTQGGDWGYRIAREMAHKYEGKSVKAWHTNYPKGAPPQLAAQPLRWLSYMLTPYTPTETAGLERTAWAWRWNKGYSTQQATRPQTLGYALTDSPVGLLAWIYEKLVEWSDGYAWTDDEVLTWVSLYWLSRAGPAATLRIYYEVASGGEKTDTMDVPPAGASGARVVFEATHKRGAHFAAHEVPELLVGDLREMFGKGGPAYGVVAARDGF